MAYRFRAKDGSVLEAVRRIAREQIDGAIGAIDRKDPAVATHEVRKCCKKVRALVRLVRPAFPNYARENAEFRDTARLLAGSRDAKVLLDTCDILMADAPSGTRPALFDALRERLARDAESSLRNGPAEGHLGSARALLEAACERIDGWTLEHDGWDAIGEGLGKILRRAQRARQSVADEPSPLHYHELRKLMKYHWYHTRLLAPVWPAIMGPRSDELSRLADVLGLHHDICVFEDRLGAMLPTIDRFDAIETMRQLAKERHRQLEREAESLVARLLAQPPRALVDHWQALWQIWRAEMDYGEAGGERD